MWPLTVAIEERRHERLGEFTRRGGSGREGASREDWVLGLDESSREKAARKERRPKAFFFPAPPALVLGAGGNCGAVENRREVPRRRGKNAAALAGDNGNRNGKIKGGRVTKKAEAGRTRFERGGIGAVEILRCAQDDGKCARDARPTIYTRDPYSKAVEAGSSSLRSLGMTN
jgi:hypothetical protein